MFQNIRILKPVKRKSSLRIRIRIYSQTQKHAGMETAAGSARIGRAKIEVFEDLCNEAKIDKINNCSFTVLG